MSQDDGGLENLDVDDGATTFSPTTSPLLGTQEEEEEVPKGKEGIDDDEEKAVLKMTRSDDTTGKDTRGDSSDDDDEMESALSNDIYSIIFTSELFSPAFMYAIFVFFFQLFFIVLLLIDLIAWGSNKNFLQVPAGMTLAVTIAAGLSMTLLVALQEDMIEASIMFAQGNQMRRDKEFEELRKINPNATMGKWFFSALLQFLVGFGLLIVIFILTMQSENVLGMALNFAALMFISEIDNVAFGLAERGFISRSVEEETTNVSAFKLRNRKVGFNVILRRTMFVFVLAIVYAGYGILIFKQRRGDFVPQKIGVQFGDEYDSNLSPLSGTYIKSDNMINGKFAYYQDSDPVRAMFAYCDDPASTAHESWTFSWWADPTWEDSFFRSEDFIGIPRDDSDLSKKVQKMFIENDPCNWSAKSQAAAHIYDITETDNTKWQVVNTRVPGGNFEFDHFSLWNAECDDCNGHGKCGGDDGNTCVCDPGFYGSDCEFDSPCPRMALDQRLEKGRIFSEDWDIDTHSDGTIKFLHHRPVYTNRLNSSTSVLVSTFSGRRWNIGIISNEFYELIVDNQKNKKYQGNLLQMPFEEFMNSFFTPSVDIYPKWYLTSAPVDHQTSSYSFTPVGLSYYELIENSVLGSLKGFASRPDLNRPWDSPLLCAACTRVSNICFDHDGMFYDEIKCLNPSTGKGVDFGEFGECTCPSGTKGSLCEYIENCIEHEGGCYNNGVCVSEGDDAGDCDCTGTAYEGHLCRYPSSDNEI